MRCPGYPIENGERLIHICSGCSESRPIQKDVEADDFITATKGDIRRVLEAIEKLKI